MEQPKKSYEQKIQELEQLVQQIENHSIPLEQLVAKHQTSLKLVEDCENELQRIEADANRLLQHEQE